MKLLIAIQNSFPTSDNLLVYTYAWKNFVLRYQKELDNCDFVFVNNGLNQQQFNKALEPCSTTHVYTGSEKFVWDTDNSFHCFYTYHDKYSHIMRIDNDAFPNIEGIKTTIKFLEEHPEVDFASASNFPRSIDNVSDGRNLELDNRAFQDKRNHHWLPWGYPTHNSDCYIFKTSFFRMCLNRYAKVITKLPVFPRTPFETSTLTYNQICNLLNYKDTRYDPDSLNVLLRIDGSINSDFWAILCSLSPVVAGITNYDGRSFMLKNHLLAYSRAKNQNVPYREVIDTIDISFPHKLNIPAPYFHTGNAYVLEHLFGQTHYLEARNIIDEFSNPESATVLQYYLVRLLATKATTDSTIFNRLESNIDIFLQKNSLDRNLVLKEYDNFINFYYSELKDYFNE